MDSTGLYRAHCWRP